MDEHREQGSTIEKERYHPLGKRSKREKRSLTREIRKIDISKGNWWEYALKGMVSIAFGIILFAWPEESLRFLVTVMGIQALVKGGIGLVQAISLAKKQEKWGLVLLESLAGLILGVIIVTQPEASIKTAAVLIGAWMIVTGLSHLVTAYLAPSKTQQGLLGAGGLLSVIIGALLVAVPTQTVDLAHTLSAIQALLLGTIFVIAGSYMLFTLRKHDVE